MYNGVKEHTSHKNSELACKILIQDAQSLVQLVEGFIIDGPIIFMTWVNFQGLQCHLGFLCLVNIIPENMPKVFLPNETDSIVVRTI